MQHSLILNVTVQLDPQNNQLTLNSIRYPALPLVHKGGSMEPPEKTTFPPEFSRGTAAREAKQMRSEGKQARIRVIGTRVILEHRDNPKTGETPGGWTQQVFV